MNKKNNMIKIVLLAICIVVLLAKGNTRSLVPTPKKSAAREWIEETFAKGKMPPFSFSYNGQHSLVFMKHWNFAAKKINTNDAAVEKYIFTYSHPKAQLRLLCEVNYFVNFEAVDWTLHLTNTSSTENSGLIQNLSAADCIFKTANKGSSTIYHALGSDAKREDFKPLKTILTPASELYLTPQGGRSSDKTAFPFFNIETSDQRGVMVAIGWTGKWYAKMKQETDRSLSLHAGMENLALHLLPGEKIRTPKICLMFWEGEDRMIGHNQFRKLILAHYTRKINGKNPQLPLAAFLDREGPAPCNEHVCATESHSIAEIKRHQQFNIVPEVFWMDAGWYPCEGLWTNVGDWTPNKQNFPNGMKPVSTAAQKAGAKFLVWFEPERVAATKAVQFNDRGQRDWITKLSGKNDLLFNLGNTEARLWITNHISDFIEKEEIAYYRQDFNFDPLPYWKSMDEKGRTGISEIRHIEGLYAFWDSLLIRFPGLVIDNCASGGRRLDLETTSRSAPFWRTDYSYGEPVGSQCHTYGINFFLPLSGTGSFEMSTYHFRSAMSSHMVTDWDVENKKNSIQDMQKLIAEFKELRPYYYSSDYYPLTDTTRMQGDDVWMAYQLNRPESNDGLILAFRRSASMDSSAFVRLKGLDLSGDYELNNKDTNEITIYKGSELLEGIRLHLNRASSSLCIKYQKR